MDAETKRLAEIRALDMEALRPTIERVTRLARTVAEAPVAYIALVDKDRVWMPAFGDQPDSYIDLDESTTARQLQEAPVWQEDLSRDWPDHPWVTGAPFGRFYANAPIALADGLRLGALCVGGDTPRLRDETVVQALSDLAALVAEAIERLRAQSAAEASARETRAATAIKEAVMRSSPVALSMTDLDLRYLYVNEQWERDKGIASADAVGRTLPEVFPHSWPVLRKGAERALAGELILADEVLAPLPGRPDRCLRVAVAPWRDSEGEIGGMISMTHDTTAMVASLARTERSEQRLKLALDIAEVSVYELNYRDKTLKIDGAADTFFGGDITYDDIAPDIWVTVHPDDRAAAVAAWERHLATGEPFRTEYRMNTPDREVWAFSAAELIKGDDGRINGVIGVLKNITSRRQSEDAMARARDDAEAANRAKSEFLANMSHEIRTPLNGVMGVASALARTPLTPAQSEMIDLIETSAQTLEAILADVLDLARVESGRLELKTEAFDLGACLRQAAALFQPSAEDKGLSFDLDIAPRASGTFVGDVVRIRQILCNLLSNAVKFTADGAVGLRARADDVGGRTRLTLTVTDTGIGFSADVKARLFERFEQADGSITRRYGGTGLGLAISRALAESMNGSLEADSLPRQGASFTLTLMLDRAAAVLAAPVAAPVELPDDRPPRVLLAEDHAINRKVVELLLGHVGVDLTCVENGADAVEAAAAEAYDLILMDMQMPIMDGLTAIRAIRAGEQASQARATPIWALSANALPEHVEASMNAGADGHLSKPVSAESLFAVLARACAVESEPLAAVRA
ncbi:MAG: ATP-binding protein [Pseudomonadota bacterium]